MNDLPTLEKAVGILDSSIGFWTWCLLGSTFVVAVGLMLEYWHPVSDFISEVKWPMAVFRWAKFMEIAGGILITVGVVGEFGFTLKVFRLEGQLEKTNLAIRDILTGKLGDAETHIRTIADLASAAKSDAKTADVTADSAQKKADIVGRRADDLLTKYEAAEKDIDELRKASIEAAKNLEEQKKRRLELAASLLPRDYWDQSGAIAKLSFFPAVSVIFEYPDADEIVGIAEQINFVLGSLGWKGSRRRGNEWRIRNGIHISVGTRQSPPPTADVAYWTNLEIRLKWREATARVLRDSLKNCDIDADIGNDGGDLSPDELLVTIGKKPNHALESTIKELGGPFSATPSNIGTNIGMRISSSRQSIPEYVPPPKQSQTTSPNAK